MAYKQIKDMNRFVNDVDGYICDTTNDLSTLPSDIPFGSKAFVIDEGVEYFLGSDGTWSPRAAGGGGGGTTTPSNLVGEAIVGEAQAGQDTTLVTKNIIANGTYAASSDGAYGYSEVSVSVPSQTPTLVTKSISANGTYTASTDSADGYSEVTVDVQSVSPTLITKNIMSNGTYDASDDNADGYSQVTVNVSGGSGGAAPSDVNFIDYDGTILYSYTKAQVQDEGFTMPDNPSHTGLTAQGWNWTLAQIRAQLAAMPNDPVTVGQMYTTSDGKTRFYIHIDDDTPSNRMTFYLRCTPTVASGVTIAWGDGTTTTTNSTSAKNYEHTYTDAGDFVIELEVTSGTVSFVGQSSNSGSVIYGSKENSNSFNRGRIRRVEIGDDVTSIGTYAFNNCYSLTSITISSDVTSIGDYAFKSCYGLTNIIIPNDVTSIESSAFQNNYSLTSITIPSGVTRIGDYAFNNCYSLTSITIPNGVTTIGAYAFSGCDSLTSITISNGVTSIGIYAFQSCDSLISITIPNGVTSISTYTFQGCFGLTSITISNGVTSIGTYAFQNNYSLTSITIPNGVTTIGAYAFSGCYGLGEIHFLPSAPPTVSNSNAWSNVQTDCKIYVPSGSLSAYTSATNYPSSSSYTYIEE